MEQQTDMKYLKLLAREYPTIAEVSTEIINLKAILCLPKGTEHFISDIHGEYEAFLHMLKNASGVVRVKVDTLFENSVTEAERNTLATLIYYPEEKLDQLHKAGVCTPEWYKITLRRLGCPHPNTRAPRCARRCRRASNTSSTSCCTRSRPRIRCATTTS